MTVSSLLPAGFFFRLAQRSGAYLIFTSLFCKHLIQGIPVALSR